MLAVIRYEFPYQVVYLLHIVTIIVAFSAAFVHPRLGALGSRLPGDSARPLHQTIVDGSVKIHFPALVLAGLFGAVLVVLSDGIYDFAQLWISLAFLVWFAMLAVLFFLLIPAERALAAGAGDEPRKKTAMYGGVLHLLLLVMLVLMVWKPGSGLS